MSILSVAEAIKGFLRKDKQTPSPNPGAIADITHFTGYKWIGLSVLPDSYLPWVEWFMDNVDWEALCQYASTIHAGKPCTLDPQIAVGGRHIVRILNFENGPRWIARLRMTGGELEAENILLQREVDCINLVKERTNVPVPAVFGYMASDTNAIGAPFMLMECLAGNAAIEMDGRGCDIPLKYRSSFYKDMARFHAETSSITFQKIGAITKSPNGSYEVGPIPGIGGPFNTASEYLEAWANSTDFDLSEIKARCGEDDDLVALEASIKDFPSKLKSLAANIPLRNHGPFPLYHSDFGHHNMVVDDNYNILGVIDWEHAQSVPWEIIDFPMTLSIPPAPIWSMLYDEHGVGKDEDMRSSVDACNEYVDMVREAEKSLGLPSTLSQVLGDKAGQDLAAALNLYSVAGKFGDYSRLFDVYRERWAKPQVQVDAGAPTVVINQQSHIVNDVS